MKLIIQSWSDIITNSSSEIFCFANNTKLMSLFLDDVIQILYPTKKLSDIAELKIIPDFSRLEDIIAEDYESIDLYEKFSEAPDKEFLLNALHLSSPTNFLPIETYLNKFDITFFDFVEHVQSELAYHDYSPLEMHYTLVPKDEDTNMDILLAVNKHLHQFADKMFDIQERYC